MSFAACSRNTFDHGTPDANGPSWLTFIGHLKDSLWSADLFESVVLNPLNSTGTSHPSCDQLVPATPKSGFGDVSARPTTTPMALISVPQNEKTMSPTDLVHILVELIPTAI